MHSGEKSNKCNQCDYASTHAFTLRRHLKTHNGEKSNRCNQCDFASPLAGNLSWHLITHTPQWRKVKKMQPIWLCHLSGRRSEETFEKFIVGKSGTNLKKIIMTLPLLMQAIWWDIWKYRVEKSPTNAINVIMLLIWQANWANIWKHTGEKPNKCNQCDFATLLSWNLSRHLKTHSGA